MAPNRGAFTQIVTTNTGVNSLVVGGTTGAATSGTGGIKAGQISLGAGLALSGGTISTHGIVMPTGVPAATTNALYNNGASALYWNGVPVLTGSATTPGGADTDVQFNDGGTFGADTGKFTYIKATDQLRVNNIGSQIAAALAITSTAAATASASIAGTAITLTASNATAGSASGVAAGGGITITSGNATAPFTGGASGGAIAFVTGTGAANGLGESGHGGAFSVTGGTGAGSGGAGGAITLRGGPTSGSGTGGAILIVSGTCNSSFNGGVGAITVKTGDVVSVLGGSTPGTITITTGALPDGSQAYPSPTILMRPATPDNGANNNGIAGGPVTIGSGDGATTSITGLGNGTAGAGGTFNLTSGAGGAVSTNGNIRLGGAGGTFNITGGVGGEATTSAGTSNTGGAGAPINVIAGTGGSATGGSGTRTGGDGGALTLGSGAAGTGATANGAIGAVIFKTGATEAARFNASANFGIGTGATVSARLHVVSTTEQARLGFDASNYLSTTVASNGGTTFAITGGGAFTFSQNVTTSAGLIQAGLVRLTGTISPTQLVANTDNWNPTGLSTANVIRIDASVPINLTGIVAQEDGRVIVLYNSSASDITLTHDATSTAANRFFCPNAVDFALTDKGSVQIRYDGTAARWSVVSAG